MLALVFRDNRKESGYAYSVLGGNWCSCADRGWNGRFEDWVEGRARNGTGDLSE